MTIRNPNPVMNLFVIDGITSSQLGKAQKPNAHFADIARVVKSITGCVARHSNAMSFTLPCAFVPLRARLFHKSRREAGARYCKCKGSG